MKRFKLTDAIPPDKSKPARKGRGQGRPHDALTPHESGLQQSNAEVNAGVKSTKDRMVDIGRGGQTAGRQGGS